MSSQLKKRLLLVTILVVIVIVALVGFVGGGTAAKSVKLADLQQTNYAGQKIQVEGNVVANSYEISGKTLTFSINDSQDPSIKPLKVTYQGAVSSTFGNGVTAICTGKMQTDGTLEASELVTKCPSKYENASNALSISKLLGYGDSIADKPVKVVGTVSGQGISVSGVSKTFTLTEASSDKVLNVEFQGALADTVKAGVSVVVTGSLNAKGVFNATEVNLEG